MMDLVADTGWCKRIDGYGEVRGRMYKLSDGTWWQQYEFRRK